MTTQLLRAQLIVSLQVDCTMDEALVVIEARAKSSKVSVDEIGAAIVDGSLRFDE